MAYFHVVCKFLLIFWVIYICASFVCEKRKGNVIFWVWYNFSLLFYVETAAEAA